VPVQSIERKLAAIFAADIAGYYGGSGFLDSGIIRGRPVQKKRESGCKRESAQRGIQGVMSIRCVRGRKPCLVCRRTLALSPQTINRSVGD
jgi:hypothetical protein